jgi:ribosome recycling factor
MTSKVVNEVQAHMKHAIDHLLHEFKHLRTGRANVAILDGLTVDYYGVPTPITQVANFSVPEATLIVAQPYDKSMLNAIEKAIRNSDLGLNPANDGKVIRIPIPTPTEERRKDLVKHAHNLAEHSRNAVRQARRDGNEKLKKMEKSHEISQDDERRGLDEIQKLHDHFIHDINSSLDKKEQDIMEV